MRGDVTLAKRASWALAIVTNKKRQFYAFTLVDFGKSAPAKEIHDGLAAVFGAKLD